MVRVLKAFKGLQALTDMRIPQKACVTYLLTYARPCGPCGCSLRPRCARARPLCEIVTPSRTGSFFSLLWALRGEIRGVRACSRAVIHCVSKPTGPCRLPEVLYLTPE